MRGLAAGVSRSEPWAHALATGAMFLCGTMAAALAASGALLFLQARRGKRDLEDADDIDVMSDDDSDSEADDVAEVLEVMAEETSKVEKVAGKSRRRKEIVGAPVLRIGQALGAATPGEEGAAPELEDLGGAPAGWTRWGRPQRNGDEEVVLPLRRPSTVLQQVPVAESVDRSDDAASKHAAPLPGRQRIFVKTSGCAHNTSDSEFMMGLLRDHGYSFANTLEAADVCLVNSCTVKNPSQDSAANLVKSAQKAGKPAVLAGCVPSADPAFCKALDGVSLLGVAHIGRVVEVIEEAVAGHVVHLLGTGRVMPSLDLPKVRKNTFIEIIPISGGCLGNCSYCKTKHARGKLSSYPEDVIIGRALQAATEGIREVWLTSEDTGAYGLDIGTNIASLLRRVADSLPAGVMLKLGMTNPPYMLAHMDAVAEVLRRPNVFSFIHVPVQSGSDQVLRSMVREYTIAHFTRLISGLRALVPDLAVATDVICGFPAEAEADHRATMALVEEFRFPALNISQFYPRPGTAAARMRKLPGCEVKRRSTEMTKLFDSYETHGDLPGREERVWFSESEVKRGQTIGHTKGYVKVVVDRDDALLGRSAMVRIERATKWHVEAHVVDDS